MSSLAELPTPADCRGSTQCWTFRSAPNIPTAQRTDSNKLLVTADLPLAQSTSLRPTRASLPWSSPKNNANLVLLQRNQYFLPKPTTKTASAPRISSPFCPRSPSISLLHLPAGRRRVTLAHCKHSPFGGGGGWFGSMLKSTLSFSD